MKFTSKEKNCQSQKNKYNMFSLISGNIYAKCKTNRYIGEQYINISSKMKYMSPAYGK